MQLDAVRDSVFDDIKLKGNWGNIYNSASKGIALNAVSNIVTCSNNVFNNVIITGFSYAIYSKQDISKNIFNNVTVFSAFKGISFGEGSNGTTIGQQFGPCDNTITNFYFSNIFEHAIYIERGINNTIENIRLDNVGNNGGSVVSIQYPQIYVGQYGNSCSDIRSDRTAVLNNSSYYVNTVTLTLSSNVTAYQGAYVQQSSTGAYGYLTANVTNSTSIILQNISVQPFNSLGNLTIDGNATPSVTNSAVHPTIVGSVQSSNYIPYLPEVTGHGVFKTFSTLSTALGAPSTYTSAIRLPVSTDQYGDPQGSIIYKIQYIFKSVTNAYMKDGIMTVSADVDNVSVKLTDEFDYTGSDPTGLNAIALDFRVRFLDQNGNIYTGALNQIPSAISIQYVNAQVGDNGTLTYTYTASF